MRLIAAIIFSAGLLALPTTPLRAQETTPPTPAPSPLDALRTKTGLTDEDRAAIRNWVSPRTAALVSDSPGNAFSELRGAATGASADFRGAFATACIDQTRAAYKNASVRAASQLITLVHSIPDAPLDAATALLFEALKDDRPSVRTAAATGLRDLRQRIATAGAAALSADLGALRDAAKRESADAVLKMIYHAMNFPDAIPNPPEPRANAQAILEVLDARAALYESGKSRTESADAAGLRAIGMPGPSGSAALIAALDDAERKRLSIAAGKMLRHAVRRYVSGPQPLIEVRAKTRNPQVADQRDRVELLIEESERLLGELLQLKPPPAAFERIRRGRNATEIVIEVNKWADKLQETANVDVHVEAPSDDSGEKNSGG
ncbi:MAG: hypothetical protein JNG88_00535 [Phycisphaerales bacterium]|nr:hypothetical protein [Phycisphaerales bacterium]